MKPTFPPVCVVDDDASVREAIEGVLRAENFEVELFASASRFLARAVMAPISCLILDVEMPGQSGLDLQHELAEAGLEIPIIFLTGRGSIPMSVKAMKAGAVEFLTKPLDAEELLNAIQEAISGSHSEELETKNDSTDAVGESRAFKAILHRIQLVAPTDSTVLILGETGTGKELVAREIHKRSRRADKPLIRVNCASIPKDLYESEFFGHVKGAFTGAFKDRVGRFEAASGGTLFLDEIGELPLEAQVRFLRVLQDGFVERVGGTHPIHVDVRVIAATHRHLRTMVDRGTFREDLFYRLHIFVIALPPLRERPDDVLPLAEVMLEDIGRQLGRRGAGLSREAAPRLLAYPWPGNVRELRNVLERAAILAGGGLITSEHLALPAPASTQSSGAPDPATAQRRIGLPAGTE
ncbi:MAG TPA: sigma-54 dependent transcriptional regulator, partial [Terrimicrobiaceae bacterium]